MFHKGICDKIEETDNSKSQTFSLILSLAIKQSNFWQHSGQCSELDGRYFFRFNSFLKKKQKNMSLMVNVFEN